MQIGFGWGKGRRVITTTYTGDALTRALAKQQTFVDHQADGAARETQQRYVDELAAWKQARVLETQTLRRENRELKRKLHMAKATLHQADPR